MMANLSGDLHYTGYREGTSVCMWCWRLLALPPPRRQILHQFFYIHIDQSIRQQFFYTHTPEYQTPVLLYTYRPEYQTPVLLYTYRPEYQTPVLIYTYTRVSDTSSSIHIDQSIRHQFFYIHTPEYHLEKNINTPTKT